MLTKNVVCCFGMSSCVPQHRASVPPARSGWWQTHTLDAPLALLAAPILKWHVDERLWGQWIVRSRQKCLGSFPQWLRERLVPCLMPLTLRCVWIPWTEKEMRGRDCPTGRANLWTRKIPETKETRTTCTNKYLYLMILGYNLSLFWSSDSISVRCVFVDVWLIQRAVGLDLRMNVLQGPWTWSWRWIWADLQRGFWAWSLKNSDERISKGFWAWSWRTVMNGSSRAFGLDLEERLDVWICRRCWSKGPLGLDLGWTDDERWCFLQGPSGLDLGRTMNEERRTLSWFFGNLDAWELRSFRASELQGVIWIGSS